MVQSEAKKDCQSIFMSEIKNRDTEEESISEKEIAYAKECVEFLDSLDFRDNDVCEETLDYIDGTI